MDIIIDLNEFEKNVLLEVKSIIDEYEEKIRISGEYFNIFQILGIQSNEVRLHNRFIGELLNPKGSHGSTYFLEQFIYMIKDKFNLKIDNELDYENTIVEIG